MAVFSHIRAGELARLGMIRLQRWESGPYFTAFSLRISDMRSFISVREIVKFCTRTWTVYI
jgi:hypothetical protein